MEYLRKKTAIVCDAARTEIGGKHFLIGIYSGDIVLQGLPSALKLSFWLEFVPKKKGAFTLQIKINVPGEKKAHIAGARINIDDLDKTAVLNIPSPTLVFQKEGNLRLSIREGDDGRWSKVIEKKVLVDADNPHFHSGNT